MAREGRPAPHLQGELDGLCGVYAIINAIRLAVGHHGGSWTLEHWRDLFYVLLLAADDEIGAARATVCGIEAKVLRRIMDAAVVHMADEHEVRLSFKRVLKRGERPATADVLTRLRAITHQPRSAVIVALHGHLDHWSVLQHVGDRYLTLFDSSRFPRVRIDNCRMSYEPRRSARREHVLQPAGLFQLTSEPS